MLNRIPPISSQLGVDAMKFNIMLVDESISVLESLQRLLKDEPYYLFAFDNPLDALKVINTLEWDIVVADQSMQKMDGLEFLERVRSHSPHTVGIIMTGDDETKVKLELLYSGNDYRFVKKPLDDIEIKHALKAAIADYKRNSGVISHEIV
jgi:DNA-binding NtrC family response regulator